MSQGYSEGVNVRNTVSVKWRGPPPSVQRGETFVVRDHAKAWSNTVGVTIETNSNLVAEHDYYSTTTNWKSTISFRPNIPVELGGSLELAFAGGVDATGQIGRTFKLFDWTGVNPNGRFEVVSD